MLAHLTNPPPTVPASHRAGSSPVCSTSSAAPASVTIWGMNHRIEDLYPLSINLPFKYTPYVQVPMFGASHPQLGVGGLRCLKAGNKG